MYCHSYIESGPRQYKTKFSYLTPLFRHESRPFRFFLDKQRKKRKQNSRNVKNLLGGGGSGDDRAAFPLLGIVSTTFKWMVLRPFRGSWTFFVALLCTSYNSENSKGVGPPLLIRAWFFLIWPNCKCGCMLYLLSKRTTYLILNLKLTCKLYVVLSKRSIKCITAISITMLHVHAFAVISHACCNHSDLFINPIKEKH